MKIRILIYLTILTIVVSITSNCSDTNENKALKILKTQRSKSMKYRLDDRLATHSWGKLISYQTYDTCYLEKWTLNTNRRSEYKFSNTYMKSITNDSIYLKVLDDEITITDDEKYRKSKHAEKVLLSERFLDEGQNSFRFKYLGIEKLRNKSCYVIEIKNKITDELEIRYIDTLTYRFLGVDYIYPDPKFSVIFSDFRPVIYDILIPFREMTISDSSVILNVLQYDSIKIVDSLPDSLFSVDRSLYE